MTIKSPVGVACHVLLPRFGVADEQPAEPQLRCFTKRGGLYRGTRPREELVPRPGGVLAHVLEDVDVPPLRVLAGSEWPSPPFAPIRDPVGVNRGIKSPADPRKPFIYGPEGLGRPVSRILL